MVEAISRQKNPIYKSESALDVLEKQRDSIEKSWLSTIERHESLWSDEIALQTSWIVMGDIISSSKYEQSKLQAEFHELIELANAYAKENNQVLSPYTITLGDEFQGVAKSLFGAVKFIEFIEFSRLDKGFEFNIRFVIYQGFIETPLNPDVAHGMLGPGLTEARSVLNDKRRNQYRVRFRFNDKNLARNLELLWFNIDGIIDKWNRKDYKLAATMLISCKSDAEIAKIFKKNPSQIWKRRKNLKIEELKGIREVASSLAASFEDHE